MAETIDALHVDVTVQVGQQKAFQVFFEQMGSWWPTEHHIGEEEFADIVVPTRAGETWGEVDTAGVHCAWGRVLSYEPPLRVVLSWGLQPEDWSYDPDQAKHSQIEVIFTPVGDGATRVELVHSKFEAYGDRGEDMRNAVGSPNGWRGMFTVYAKLAAA